jgi:hypothetical protein
MHSPSVALALEGVRFGCCECHKSTPGEKKDQMFRRTIRLLFQVRCDDLKAVTMAVADLWDVKSLLL